MASEFFWECQMEENLSSHTRNIQDYTSEAYGNINVISKLPQQFIENHSKNSWWLMSRQEWQSAKIRKLKVYENWWVDVWSAHYYIAKQIVMYAHI